MSLSNEAAEERFGSVLRFDLAVSHSPTALNVLNFRSFQFAVPASQPGAPHSLDIARSGLTLSPGVRQ